MSKSGRNDESNQPTNDQPEQPVNLTFEPFVDADVIAELIDQPRPVVVRMARECKITSYAMSGRQRLTYKFKRSEVIRDVEKLRRPSSTPPDDNPDSKNSSGKK